MLSPHCHHHDPDTELQEQQRTVLKVVLVINLAMFFIEMIAGVLVHSTALLADSLDMLGDALIYALSLFVLTRNQKWKAGSALIKGIVLLVLGCLVLGTAIYKMIFPILPMAMTITLIGILALAANAICAFLLLRHSKDDINMNSVWLCSRNDLINNIGVIIAGLLVAISQSMWPDIIIGLAMATLFIKTAIGIIFRSLKELKI